jgi:UDP-MurNAc hydroxylase
MRITFLGHAGFCVEAASTTIVMDPWLSPTGAFDGAWFQFPRNHHLADFVQQKLAEPGRRKLVYISHQHKDHFDLPFLESLQSRDFTLVIARFDRPVLDEALAHYTCSGVVACADGQAIEIDGGYVKLFVDDQGLNRDSGVLVRCDGQTFLNLNDCKIYDRLPAIAAEGSIDVLACQFSGATWHPTCYEYPRATYERISRRKLFSKFESVAQAIRSVAPRVYLPSAGPACFLDPDLIHLNFESVNIFPRARTFIDYLDRRLPDLPSQWKEVQPGDALDVASAEYTWLATERVEDADFANYVTAYAAEYAQFFRDLKRGAQTEHDGYLDVFEGLRHEFRRKLRHFSLSSRMHVPLYVGLTEVTDLLIEVDFVTETVNLVDVPANAHHYCIRAPAWELRRVLDGAITWEDLSLTFRARLRREPDVYQTILQAFLILEAEDLEWFCCQMVALENSAERTVIEAGGRSFSVTRYCPHQGGDLAMGRAVGRHWVCPRHGWQFDLERDGVCTTNDSSIHAIPLEPD